MRRALLRDTRRSHRLRRLLKHVQSHDPPDGYLRQQNPLNNNHLEGVDEDGSEWYIKYSEELINFSGGREQ